MTKNTNSIAKHFYAEAYANYLKSGDLHEATRQVAHEEYLHRGNAPGTPIDDWHAAELITRDWPHTITEASESHLFDKLMAKTRQWIKEIELELGFSNPNDAYRALRGVLHAIRDRLPAKESTEFAAQLPMLLTGMYYSGWTPLDKPVKMRDLNEFMDYVAQQLPRGQDPMRVTQGVITVIARHVTSGELKDVRRNFPEKMQELWNHIEQPAQAGKTPQQAQEPLTAQMGEMAHTSRR